MADTPYPIPDWSLAQFGKHERDIITGVVIPKLADGATVDQAKIDSLQTAYKAFCTAQAVQPVYIGSKWVEGMAVPAQAVGP